MVVLRIGAAAGGTLPAAEAASGPNGVDPVHAVAPTAATHATNRATAFMWLLLALVATDIVATEVNLWSRRGCGRLKERWNSVAAGRQRLDRAAGMRRNGVRRAEIIGHGVEEP